MNELTQYELALLRAVEKGKGQWGWYQIAHYLPSLLELDYTPHMLNTLKNLAERGLVTRYRTPNAWNDRWELTEQGTAILEQLADDQ